MIGLEMWNLFPWIDESEDCILVEKLDCFRLSTNLLFLISKLYLVYAD